MATRKTSQKKREESERPEEHDAPRELPWGEQPPVLTEEDERILDRIWDRIGEEERRKKKKKPAPPDAAEKA